MPNRRPRRTEKDSVKRRKTQDPGHKSIKENNTGRSRMFGFCLCFMFAGSLSRHNGTKHGKRRFFCGRGARRLSTRLTGDFCGKFPPSELREPGLLWDAPGDRNSPQTGFGGRHSVVGSFFCNQVNVAGKFQSSGRACSRWIFADEVFGCRGIRESGVFLGRLPLAGSCL